jgi:hypothetical protein
MNSLIYLKRKRCFQITEKDHYHFHLCPSTEKSFKENIPSFFNFFILMLNICPVNRDIKMAPPCKRYRKVYTWQVSSIRHIINISEFATLGGCRSPRHTAE